MSILNDEEIKQQTRQLRKVCLGETDDFLDIFFEEKYTPACNLTQRFNARLTAACQLLPYRFTFFGSVLHAGFVTGLCTAPSHRRQGLAARLLREAHRRLYKQGGAVSFLLPADEEQRHFFEEERHGAYWTATFRHEVELDAGEESDDGIRVTEPDEWGRELFVFFQKNTRDIPFMLHPAEGDFFAALRLCDATGGRVLVARRGGHVCGIALVAAESNGQLIVRDMLADGDAARNALLRAAQGGSPSARLTGQLWCPGSTKGAKPYAMARVTNVMRFLECVVRAYPGFQLHIGVDHDFDIPENNGYYHVADGRVALTDERPDNIVTPGGLAAMLLGANPVMVRMMLDE